MKAAAISIDVPEGFRVQEEVKAYPLEQAKDILLSKRQRNFSAARRRDDGLGLLTSHTIKCPFCGKTTSAYQHSYQNTSPAAVLEWANEEPSFLPFSSHLHLNSLRSPEPRYQCPRCNLVSRSSQDSQDVTIRIQGQKIWVHQRLHHIPMMHPACSLVKDSWNADVTEAILFNLKNGHVSVHIRDKNGASLLVRDLTGAPCLWAQCRLYWQLRNRVLKRKLVQAFRRFWPGPFPFTLDQVSSDMFLPLTQFVGFSREFYYAIPYQLTGHARIDKSFRSIAKKLRRADKLRALYANSSLPKDSAMESLLLHSHQGLLFYLPEIEALWAANAQMFVAALLQGDIYKTLSLLHNQNQTLRFSWEKDPPPFRHSIPLRTDPNISDFQVKDYRFTQLKTSYDYARMNRALGLFPNCQEPIVIISRCGKPVAWCPISGQDVQFVLGQHLQPVRKTQTEFIQAFERFCKQFSLNIPDMVWESV